MSAINIAINLVGHNLAGGAFATLSGDMSHTIGIANSLKGALKDLKPTTATLGGAAIGAGLAFMAFSTPMKTGIENAAELEQKLLMLKQAIQANSDAMPVLTQSVNDLGVKTVYSSSEAADAFALLIRSGFNVSQVMYGAGAAADEYKQHAYDATKATHGLGFEALALGQALKISANDGANLAAAALHTFKSEIENASDPTAKASAIINDLAGAYLNGARSGSDLLSFLQQAGPTAASMNISFQDFVTTGDVLAQSMGSMAQAGTRLRYFLGTLTHPTNAQAKEMANLGIQVVNANGAYKTLESQLIKTGGATADQIKLWDGSVTGLQKMFTAAQNVGLIPLDTTFGSWATQNDLLNNKLYDSQGQFKGMKNAVDILFQSLKDKTPEERTKALADMFNVRGGDAGRILANMTSFDQQYKTIWDRIGKTDAVSMALQQLDTLKGATDALKDSLNSGLAVAFLNILPHITTFVNKLNDLVGIFLNAPPQMQTAVGIFLIVGTVLSGIAFAALGIAAAVSVLLPLITAIGAPVGVFVAALVGAPLIILAVAGAIAGLAAYISTHQGDFKGFGDFFSTIGTLAQTFWVILRANVLPVLQNLWTTVQGELAPAWKNLQDALTPLMPLFKNIGEGLLVLLGGGVGILIAIIVGAITFLATFIAGVIEFVAGIIEVIAGFIKLAVDYWGGFFQILGDLFSGNWSKLKKDAHDWFTKMWDDVKAIGKGLWDSIKGLWTAGVESLKNGGKAIYDTVVGWFSTLFDKLVGHSIVPDLVNKVVEWFNKLPGKVGDAIHNMVTNAMSGAQNLGSRLVQAVSNLPARFTDVGHNIMQGLINGMRNMGPNAVGAISGLMGDALAAAKHRLNIKSPSGVFHEVGQNTIQGFVNGVLALKDQAHSAVGQVVGYTPTSTLNVASLGVNRTQVAYASAQLQSQQTPQPINIYLGNEKLASYVFDRATSRLKQSGVSRMRG